MLTEETFVFVTVPVADVTAQVWLGDDGCVRMVTAYVDPLITGVAKAKAPLALNERSSPALSCRTMVPFRPAIVPPTVKVFVAQLTITPVTPCEPTVPLPAETTQVWTGAAGWVRTVTA